MPRLKTKKLLEYEVFHSKDEFFNTSISYGSHAEINRIKYAFLHGMYKSVHTFELPADDVERQLERVFHDSQNFEESWCGDPTVRSTSVGDIVRVGKDYWVVASVGFDLLWRDRKPRSPKTSAFAS